MFGVQATIDMEMEGKVMELKKEKDLLGRRHMDRDNALRKVSRIKSFLSACVECLRQYRKSMKPICHCCTSYTIYTHIYIYMCICNKADMHVDGDIT